MANWTFRQRQYQMLSAIPQEYRPKEYKSETAIADALGVSLTTLKAWRNLPGWWDEVNKYATNIIGDKLPEIYEAMVNKALGGDVSAAKFCTQALGVVVEPTPIQIKNAPDQLVIIMPPQLVNRKLEAIEAPKRVLDSEEGTFIEVRELETEDG